MRAPPLPTELQVEVTASCNLRCQMCLVAYRPAQGRGEGAMPLSTFTRVVDALPHLEKVTLQGLGEPLLAPGLDDMIAHAAARGAAVGFNSNGMLLTPARSARLVAAGLAWLHVSLDGATAATHERIRAGADFERIAANVRGLVEARRRLASATPLVALTFVAMRRNVGELPALVRLAGEWGVDKVYVQNLSHSFSDTDPSGEYAGIRAFHEAEALWEGGAGGRAFEDADAVAAEVGVDLRLPEGVEPAGARSSGEPGCHWPFTSAYVTADGKAQPCCMVMGSDRATLGDVTVEHFPDVWRGEAYESFRDALRGDDPPAVCKGCSLYRRVF